MIPLPFSHWPRSSVVSPLVNFVICGRFHYFRYLRFLPEEALGAVYFSHRVGEMLGLPPAKIRNLFVKEYLQQAHVRVLGPVMNDAAQKLYHSIWRMQLKFRFTPAKQNYFLAHGACLPSLIKSKVSGGQVIVEAVNCHPLSLARELEIEHQNFGLARFKVPDAWAALGKELHMADFVVCPSRFIQATLTEHGIPRERTEVISYGCTPEEGRWVDLRAPVSSQVLRVVCVAQVIPRKGQCYLLRAVNELTGRGFKIELTLVGAADSRYLSVLSEQGCHYTHINHINHADMSTFLKTFDVLVLPSVEDGFGNVVGEALSAGIPAIATAACGASEILMNYDGNLVVAPRDTKGLAEALKYCAARKSWPRIYLRGWRDHADDLAKFLNCIRPAAQQNSGNSHARKSKLFS